MPRMRIADKRAASASCKGEHTWVDLPVPGESKGRIYRCSSCGTCGHRMNRFGGAGKVVALTCNVGGNCKCDAKVRLFGRARRGSFRWACVEHSMVGPRPVP